MPFEMRFSVIDKYVWRKYLNSAERGRVRERDRWAPKKVNLMLSYISRHVVFKPIEHKPFAFRKTPFSHFN